VVVVSPAEPKHVEAIAQLFEEMDRFYGDTTNHSLDVRVRQITDALFGDASAGSALLAWDSDELVGLAAYSFLWPAIGVSRSLYLKELYVGEVHRRKGVGKLLMDALFEVAKNYDCTRVEWTTDDTNENAQQFYNDLGVPVDTSKIFYRIEIGTQ
jgi:GNAT superfamily N-acetyltransferase